MPDMRFVHLGHIEVQAAPMIICYSCGMPIQDYKGVHCYSNQSTNPLYAFLCEMCDDLFCKEEDPPNDCSS